MIASLAGLALLAGAAAALGAPLSLALPWPEGPGREAVVLTAGVGATALLLALLALGGLLMFGPALLLALSVPGWFLIVRHRPRSGSAPGWSVLAAALVALAALSAVAPVTDPDSLAYPLPIARRLAETGSWRFWPDLALSVFPLAQEMLLAVVLQLGGTRPGLVAAGELLLCAALLSSLAARAGVARGTALLVGLGCPVVAYLAPSAKEDLLLCAFTLACAHALLDGRAAAAGLFAGLAASTKYSGLPLAAGALLAVVLLSPGRRLRRAAQLAGCALLAGGLSYAVNLARFGNPVPPYLSPPLPGLYPESSRAVALAAFRWGAGRDALDLLLAPLRMLTHPDLFGTAGGLFNPLAWIGLLALGVRDTRLRFAPLFLLAGALYAAWLATDQVARLLLPAALLLAVPAAEMLSRAARLLPAARVPIAAALGLSGVSLALVSGVRLGRYAAAPGRFLAAETQNAEDLAFLNARLDPHRHRVATTFKACAGLRIPWINLGAVYQVEIPADAVADVATLRAHGITHLFVPQGSMPELEAKLIPIRRNPASRLGGVHLFREPPTIATSVYELPRDNRPGTGGR